jgi:hypothetical protein
MNLNTICFALLVGKSNKFQPSSLQIWNTHSLLTKEAIFMLGNPSIKEGCLFVLFVFVWFVLHVDIPQIK